MKISFFIILFFASINLCFCDEPDKKMHLECLYPTIQLIGPGFSGSGFIVRSEPSENHYLNVMITSAHIIMGETPHDISEPAPTIQNSPFRRLVIKVPKYENWSEENGYDEYQKLAVSHISIKYDMAILIFESDKKLPVAQLGFDEKYYLISKIFKVGFGGGKNIRVDSGEITSVKSDYQDCIQINAATIQGDSGGPCFLENYKVIGIVRAIKRMENFQVLTNFSYICPVDWIKKWNKENNNEIEFVFNDKIKIPTIDSVIKNNKLKHLEKMSAQLRQELEEKKILLDKINNELQSIR